MKLIKIALIASTLFFLACSSQTAVPIHILDEGWSPKEAQSPLDRLKEPIPILMYHYVRTVDAAADPLGWNLSVEPDLFEAQLKWLQDHDYQTVHFSDLFSDKMLPAHPVILSFDDGLSDFSTTALPLLKKYNFTASNAVITGMIGEWEHMTLDQIKECQTSGVEFFSHSVSHPDLTSLSSTTLSKELTESKAYLEENLGISMDVLVYPSGKVNGDVKKATEEAGYHYALTTQEGTASFTEDDPLLLPRLRIDNRLSLEDFASKMEKAALE